MTPETPARYVEITVTHEGEGINGTIRQLQAAGYYATLVGNAGDIAIMYGPRAEFLSSRLPYIALVGDTFLVPIRN